MNSINATLDKSDYENYDDFLNYQIDGFWLDEKLEGLYPDNWYKGTVPTLLFWMEIDKEREVVWDRILPEEGEKVVCPILMCPDDCDFSCTLIVALIENSGKRIIWNQIGVDQTKHRNAENFGSNVNWLSEVPPYIFEIEEYRVMIEKFRKQFEVDKLKWEKRHS